MGELIRFMVIASLVAGSARATFVGYDLVMASIDSMMAQTYSTQNFQGEDYMSASMRQSLDEINKNHQATKHSINATTYNTGNDKP